MKTFLLTFLGLTLLGLASYFNFEPGIISAASSTGTTTVTLIVTSEISVTPDATIAMSPNIATTQDTSIGSGNFVVKTNDAAGYTMSFRASSTPALHDAANSFADYTDSGSPEAWSVGAGAYEFGFSAYGTDVSDGTWDAGQVSCGSAGADSLTSSVKWRGFTGTTPITGVASRSTVTDRVGVTTTLCVAAEQGNSVYAPTGTYYATIVGTATTQ